MSNELYVRLRLDPAAGLSTSVLPNLTMRCGYLEHGSRL
jgi:hypothetical protein